MDNINLISLLNKRTNSNRKNSRRMSLGSHCEDWEYQRLRCGMADSDFIAHLLALHRDNCTRTYKKLKGRQQPIVDSVLPRPPIDPGQQKRIPPGTAAGEIQLQTSFDTIIRRAPLPGHLARHVPMSGDNPRCPPSEHQISQLNYNNTIPDAVYHAENQTSKILPLNSTAAFNGYIPIPLYSCPNLVHSSLTSTGTSVDRHSESNYSRIPVSSIPKALEVEPITIAPLGNPCPKQTLVHLGGPSPIVPPVIQNQPPQMLGLAPQLHSAPPPYGRSDGPGGIQYVILNPSSGQISYTNSITQRPSPFLLGADTGTNDTLANMLSGQQIMQPQSETFNLNVDPVVIQPQINSPNKPNHPSVDIRQDIQQNDDIYESSLEIWKGGNLINYPQSNASPIGSGFALPEETIHPSIPGRLATLPADENHSCQILASTVPYQTNGQCSNHLTATTVHSGLSSHSMHGREMAACLKGFTETANKLNFKALQRRNMAVVGGGSCRPIEGGDESEKKENGESAENVRNIHSSDKADMMLRQSPLEGTSAKSPPADGIQHQTAATDSQTSQQDIKGEEPQDENTTSTQLNDMVLKCGKNNRKRKQTFLEDINTKEDAQFTEEQWPNAEMSVKKPNTKRYKLEKNQETTKRHKEMIPNENNDNHPKTENEESIEECQCDVDSSSESPDTEMSEKQAKKSKTSDDVDWDPATYYQTDSEEEAHKKKHSKKGERKERPVKIKKTTAKYHDTFHCDQCNAKFEYTWAHLVAHKIQEHPEPRNLNKCDICDASFDEEADLRKHAADVHAMDEFPDRKLNHLICPDCEEAHPLALSYIFHREDKHESCIVTCLLCDFVADHRYQMKTHMDKAHDRTTFVKYSASMVLKKTEARRCRRDGSRISCFICGAACDSLKDMVNHRKEKHADVLQQDMFTCTVCNMTSPTYRGMLTHYNAHMRNTQCRFCTKTLATDCTLTMHVKDIHCHIKEFCEECNLFLKRFQKTGHIARVHHDVRRKLCETCGRGFKTHSALQIHRLIHTGENPLGCSHCEYRCRQKTSLDWHMKTTHPDKVTVQIIKPGGRPHGKALTKKNSNVKVQKPAQVMEIKKATLKQAGNNKAKIMTNVPKYVEDEIKETDRPHRKRSKKVMMDL